MAFDGQSPRRFRDPEAEFAAYIDKMEAEAEASRIARGAPVPERYPSWWLKADHTPDEPTGWVPNRDLLEG